MKLSNNQSFSTPVITNEEEYFVTNIDFDIEFLDPCIRYELTCTSEYIEELLREEKVSFVVNIEGSNPAFRITEVIENENGIIEIPKFYLKGNINVTLLVIAKENFILQSDEIIFSGEYYVDKHQIIGYVPSQIVKMSLDKSMSELISFNLSDKDVIEYNYSDSSIDIYFPKETYLFINQEKNNKKIRSTLFNTYVYPALIAYLYKMKFEEEDTLLFNTFNEILISKGINIEDDSFINKIPECASNILNNSYASIPKEIRELKGAND